MSRNRSSRDPGRLPPARRPTRKRAPPSVESGRWSGEMTDRVITFSVRIPVSTCRRLSMLLRSRSAPVTRISETATSPTTIMRRTWCAHLRSPAPIGFSECERLRIAGSAPTSKATPRTRPLRTRAHAGQSDICAVRYGFREELGRASDHQVSDSDARRAPSRHKTRLSVSNCPSRRP